MHPLKTTFLALFASSLAANSAVQSWMWEATVVRASFNKGSTTLPWTVSVGDTVTGTFTIDYSDVGVSTYPNVRDYPSQPFDLVTAYIDGVAVWEGYSGQSPRIQIQDEPDYLDPHTEILSINRQISSDPRMSGLVVAGGMLFRDSSGTTFDSTALPKFFDLTNFDVSSFGLFVGDNQSTIIYDFEARLTQLTAVPEPSVALFTITGVVSLSLLRRRR
jgi:hypothetical protein